MTNLILHGAATQYSTLQGAAVWDSVTGIKQSLVHWFFPTANGSHLGQASLPTPLPLTLADQLWQQGQLLLLSWATWDLATQIVWTPADIVAGRYDSYFHQQAAALKAWRHPLFIRLNWEMNGTWEKWHSDGPSFVSAWQHIVSLFRADGATNATWVWCPNQLGLPGSASSLASDKLAPYYPGDSFVDWTALDAYNAGTPKGMPWLTFSQMISGGVAGLGDTYGTIAAIAPGKPMMIAEFGSTDGAGPTDRTVWMSNALEVIPASYPLIRAVNYYNVADPLENWVITQMSGPAQAWAKAITAGPYAQHGVYPMPPDLKPILPLQAQAAQSWGPPV